jgi:hypothetical protein
MTRQFLFQRAEIGVVFGIQWRWSFVGANICIETCASLIIIQFKLIFSSAQNSYEPRPQGGGRRGEGQG